jgi:hypothetical protein
MKLKFISTLLLISLSWSAFCQNSRSIENVGLGVLIIIETATNGDVWAGSLDKGVAFINGSTGQTVYFGQQYGNTQFKNDSITSISYGIVGGAQVAFIGTKNGLISIRNGVVDSINIPDPHVTGVSLAGSDTLWVSTPTGLLALDTGAAHTVKAIYNTGNSSIPFNLVSVSGRGGKQCAGEVGGSPNSGAFYTAGGTFVKIDTSLPGYKLVDNRVTTILRDNNCNVFLIGTMGGFSICPRGQQCRNFTTANGLPQNEVTSLGQDCNGNVYIGTRDSGVVIFSNPNTFTRLTTSNGLTDNHVTAISFSGGQGSDCSGYIGTRDGNLAQVDSNKVVVRVLNGVADVSIDVYTVNVYPQPSGTQVTFALGRELNSGELSLTDLSGRTVQTLSITNRSTITADVSMLPQGLYFYRLADSGRTVKTGKVQIVR